MRNHQQISNPCSNIQSQCSQLESKRNKEDRKKNPKIYDLKQNASPQGTYE